jgi:hypothetical protein
MVGRQHPRDEIAEGVAHDDRLAVRHFLGDHGSDVGGVVVQRQAGQRAGTAADAARLRAQHAKPVGGEIGGDRVVIIRPTAERRQDDDGGTAALGQHDDMRVAMIDDDRARRIGGVDRRHGAQQRGQRDGADEQARKHAYPPL